MINVLSSHMAQKKVLYTLSLLPVMQLRLDLWQSLVDSVLLTLNACSFCYKSFIGMIAWYADGYAVHGQQVDGWFYNMCKQEMTSMLRTSDTVTSVIAPVHTPCLPAYYSHVTPANTYSRVIRFY